jgi:hypothetical protein
MKSLLNRHACIASRISSLSGAYGDLVPSEESVVLWLRAWPRLLGWRRSINWLWPPIVDCRRKSLPSLWGVDSIGSPVFVGIRIDRGDAPDPFADFVRYVKSASMKRQWRADALHVNWLDSVRNAFAPEAIARGYSLPVFVGVIASPRSDFRLSGKPLKNLKLLQEYVGHERVLVCSISATLHSRGLRIRCRTPESEERGRVVTSPLY